MPTGYTEAVVNGTIEDFPAFAMRCARAIGHLAVMRDEPLDAPIPHEFEPTSYHLDKIAEAEAELSKLDAMTAEEIDAAAKASFEKNRAAIVARNERYDAEDARLKAMLAKVLAWAPPTPDHEHLKSFMVEQLHTSLNFQISKVDLNEPIPPATWLADRISDLKRDIDYHTRAHAEEVERCRRRNEWVRQLRESLAS